MRLLTNLERSFETPQATVQLLLGVNVAIFCLCIIQAKTATIPAETLFRYGAMHAQAIDRHEYWRLIAHGFLHANPLHIFANMLCLTLWGGLLEKRVGALYFTFIYVAGLVAGAIVSQITHAGAYLAVGASGAISAVLGALLSLRLLGRIGLPWIFFGINIGLNVALAASLPRVDWGAHLGGFAAGMICCACLDLIERMLRCKFPEFVKINAFIVAAAVVVVCWDRLLVGFSQNVWQLALATAVAGLAAIKVLDLTLSMKKGLAVVVVALALANAVLVLLLKDALAKALAPLCTGQRSTINAIAVMAAKACADVDLTINVTALIVFALTMLVYWRPFARGVSDVGFVGAALRGERARQQGL
jgi:membrane associated rhomboid family serine protease